MANTLAPIGFVWHGTYGDQVSPTAGLITMKIAAGDTSSYGEFDPLKFLSTGYVTAFTRGTGASQFAGNLKAVSYYSTGQGRRVWKNYWPGSDATGDVSALVVPASGSIAPRFRVQSSGATAITAGSIFNNVDVPASYLTASSVVGGYYRSNATIDLAANIGTTATLPFRIIGLWSDIGAPGSPGTDNTTPYNWVLVEANNIQATGI